MRSLRWKRTRKARAFDLWNIVRCCTDAYLYVAMRMKEDRAEEKPAA